MKMLEKARNAPQLCVAGNALRRRALQMTCKAGLGHVGGDFSAADILTVLHQAVLRIDPKRPDWPDRDRFVLSKGHASGSYYAALAAAGFFSDETLESYMA